MHFTCIHNMTATHGVGGGDFLRAARKFPGPSANASCDMEVALSLSRKTRYLQVARICGV
jgi:hypothetical protein